MLQGFNPWQKRITMFGTLGVILTILGLFGPWLQLIVGGIALAISCLLALVLLGNRQNWRQLRAIQRQVEKSDGSSLKSDETSASLTAPSVPGVGVQYEFALRIRTNRSAIESFALRSKSLKIRDAFALAATASQFQYEDLMRFISVQRMKMLPQVKQSDLHHWDTSALFALARLQANQRAAESDLENAVRTFSFIQTFFGIKSFGKNDRLIYIEALGELKRYEHQSAVVKRFNIERQFPVQAHLIELNVIRSESDMITSEWVRILNQLFESHGFSSVNLTASREQKPLDRLSTEVSPLLDGPKVSVIVPTFQGGSLLLSALQSILNQSWQNLEILVVDDGSGQGYESYLAQAEKLSSKIKVIRQEQNLGAYCARNAGLAMATGEYITVHDDDDWSHGDKIATQVHHLLEHPDIPANMSAHVRVTDELKFTRINNNPVMTQANFSSVMAHRSVFDKIGGWDTVNRGADSELRDRLVKYYDQPVTVLDDVPLSFTRTWEGSLTSGEMNRGFVDPSRLLYLNAYTQAHQAVGNDASLLRFSDTRHYPVPSTMEPGARNKDLGTFDVAFMTDFRFPGGTTSLTLKEIEVASQSGLRVGFIHAESPLNGPNHPVSPKLFEMQLQGKVEQIGLQDTATLNLLVIRHPSVTTFLDQTTTNLKVRKSTLVVNNPPVLKGGTGMVFDLPTSISNIDRLFNHRTTVTAESGVTRKLCETLVPVDRLSSATWPGLVSLGELVEPDFQLKPTVGRHSRDHALKWPSTSVAFKAAYVSSSFQTKILGGTAELTNKHGQDVIEGITVYEFGELEVPEFLSSIDFWVYFHDDKLTESFGMSIAEALAAGKIVILPKYLQSSFGDAAIYVTPEDVESVVQGLWNNPEKYSQQSERARLYVRQNFSNDAFLDRLKLLMNDM